MVRGTVAGPLGLPSMVLRQIEAGGRPGAGGPADPGPGPAAGAGATRLRRQPCPVGTCRRVAQGPGWAPSCHHVHVVSEGGGGWRLQRLTRGHVSGRLWTLRCLAVPNLTHTDLRWEASAQK